MSDNLPQRHERYQRDHVFRSKIFLQHIQCVANYLPFEQDEPLWQALYRDHRWLPLVQQMRRHVLRPYICGSSWQRRQVQSVHVNFWRGLPAWPPVSARRADIGFFAADEDDDPEADL